MRPFASQNDGKPKETSMPEQTQKKLKIDFVEIERLLLDDENPRLSEG